MLSGHNCGSCFNFPGVVLMESSKSVQAAEDLESRSHLTQTVRSTGGEIRDFNINNKKTTRPYHFQGTGFLNRQEGYHVRSTSLWPLSLRESLADEFVMMA